MKKEHVYWFIVPLSALMWVVTGSWTVSVGLFATVTIGNYVINQNNVPHLALVTVIIMITIYSLIN